MSKNIKKEIKEKKIIKIKRNDRFIEITSSASDWPTNKAITHKKINSVFNIREKTCNLEHDLEHETNIIKTYLHDFSEVLSKNN